MFCLLGVLWLSIAPLFSSNGCGLLVPHDHILLGGASETDLYAHLMAEAACAAGHAPAETAEILPAHSGTGRVVSISHTDSESAPLGGILGIGQLALLLPALPGGGLLSLFVWRLPSLQVMARSWLFPPRDPPPEPAAQFAI